jgi:hypothetical protein
VQTGQDGLFFRFAPGVWSGCGVAARLQRVDGCSPSCGGLAWQARRELHDELHHDALHCGAEVLTDCGEIRWE